ncbi:hypothetical protein [Floccifex sp.]|uniref:hypothetical protein n=1 Tax=Floccifex sp. TaxID=2815810 RepID=UPI003F00698E
MNNGFSLYESLLSLLIVLICIALLMTCITSFKGQKERIYSETIKKEWFYTD